MHQQDGLTLNANGWNIIQGKRFNHEGKVAITLKTLFPTYYFFIDSFILRSEMPQINPALIGANAAGNIYQGQRVEVSIPYILQFAGKRAQEESIKNQVAQITGNS